MPAILRRAGVAALRATAALPSLTTITEQVFSLQAHGPSCSCVTCNSRTIHSSAAPHGLNCPCVSCSGRSSAVSGTSLWFGAAAAAQTARYSTSIQYPAAEVAVGAPAPDFTAPAVVDGEFKTISLSQYKGKYVCLFFYPKDFTFVCPTEIIAFSDRAKEFKAINTQLIAASTDTEETHLAWIKTPRNKGGLGYMQIPILADTTKEIAARYGVLIAKSGIALRGLFIIDPEGIVRQITVNDLPIGRSVDEALRLVQAIQFHAEHGEVCPANWQPGSRSMIADPEKSLEYFEAMERAETPDDIGTKLHPIKSKKEFDALVASGKPLMVDFYAPWCGKCRMIGPFVDELVPRFPNVTFAKFDTTLDGLEAVSTALGVKALPAFKFYKGGKEVADTVIGYKKKPLEEAVTKLAGM